MDPVVPISSVDLGNTISKSTKQISPCIRWCFTLNNYSQEECSSITSIFSEKCKFAIVGKEVGEQGTPHLQGYVEFKTKVRPKTMFTDRIHWEKAKANRQANIDYCSKQEVWFSIGLPKPIKIIEKLYKWQEEIEMIIKDEPDDRKVYWYWEPNGNIGKSAFIKYCYVKHKIGFCSGGKYSDIMNYVFNQDMDTCNCVMFDIPRCNNGHVSYSAIESIKNGLVFNAKYETGAKVFNSPHVIVFANEPPDEEMLSNDRWEIKRIY